MKVKIRYIPPLINALLLACLFYMHAPSLREARSAEDDGQLVTRVYVIRRPLDGALIGSAGPLAHSGLLLQTKAGEYYVLEYMNDSRAWLTAGTPKELGRDTGRKVANIKMNGIAGGKVVIVEWERQLHGSALEPKWTPEQLQQKMQIQMKRYNVWKAEHCHQAQERLRREVGLLK